MVTKLWQDEKGKLQCTNKCSLCGKGHRFTNLKLVGVKTGSWDGGETEPEARVTVHYTQGTVTPGKSDETLPHDILDWLKVIEESQNKVEDNEPEDTI